MWNTSGALGMPHSWKPENATMRLPPKETILACSQTYLFFLDGCPVDKCCSPLHYADITETFGLLTNKHKIQLIARVQRNFSWGSCLKLKAMQLLKVKYLQRRYFSVVWAVRFFGGKRFDRADAVHDPNTLTGWNRSLPTHSPTL